MLSVGKQFLFLALEEKPVALERRKEFGGSCSGVVYTFPVQCLSFDVSPVHCFTHFSCIFFYSCHARKLWLVCEPMDGAFGEYLNLRL